MTKHELKALGLLSTILLDRWQYGGGCRWQYLPSGGHLVPLAASRGGLGEVVGVLLLALFLELTA